MLFWIIWTWFCFLYKFKTLRWGRVIKGCYFLLILLFIPRSTGQAGRAVLTTYIFAIHLSFTACVCLTNMLCYYHYREIFSSIS